MGSTGNLPVLPGYQPGGTTMARQFAKRGFSSTVCPPHSGRQVADRDRLVACSTLIVNGEHRTSNTSEGRWAAPMTQEFQLVFQVLSGAGFAHLHESPQFLANGSRLLIADDDASMMSPLMEEV